MKTNKIVKAFLMMVAAVIAAFGITGCDSRDSSSGASTKGAPPISLSFSHAAGSSSDIRTVLITNRSSSETVVVRLSVKNDEEDESASTVVTIAPGKTHRMEEMTCDEGTWVFMKGEVVTLKADGYSGSVSRTIN